MKMKTIEDLKQYIETRNEINFYFEFIEDNLHKKREENEMYYLKTKKGRDGRSLEIYRDCSDSGEAVFNVYGITAEGETAFARIRCTYDRVEDILRNQFGIRPRQVQERLL